jgi:hypothetical protein
VRVLALQAVLAEPPPSVSSPSDGVVVRTIAIREDQTLEQLHEALRLAFGWADPHLHSFWPSGRFWDTDGDEYTAPVELEERGEHARSARTPLAELGRRKGSSSTCGRRPATRPSTASSRTPPRRMLTSWLKTRRRASRSWSAGAETV